MGNTKELANTVFDKNEKTLYNWNNSNKKLMSKNPTSPENGLPNNPINSEKEGVLSEEVHSQTQETSKQIESISMPISASFEEMAEKIPELKEMIGFNQRSDFHSLSLADHTKKVTEGLKADPFIQNHPKKDLIILAGILHDLGKLSPQGSQVHPKDPEKRQYMGHEEQSAIMSKEIMQKYFASLSEEDMNFVSFITGLHASALNLITSFESAGREPKGKKLQAFEKFILKVEEMPGNLSLEEKMRVIFAINRADKMAGFNDKSDLNDPKVLFIKEKADKQVSVLKELEKAIPAIIEAIEARKNGKQNAGVKLIDGKYIYESGDK